MAQGKVPMGLSILDAALGDCCPLKQTPPPFNLCQDSRTALVNCQYSERYRYKYLIKKRITHVPVEKKQNWEGNTQMI